MDIGTLTTEARNPATTDLDAMSVPELLTVMNAEDARVAPAVGAAADSAFAPPRTAPRPPRRTRPASTRDTVVGLAASGRC